MLDLGNLYTAALPAWIAAGFEQALDEDSLEVGEEVLTLGYGSGDAAEVIPFFIADGWREATREDRFCRRDEIDRRSESRAVPGAARRPPSESRLRADRNEFVIDRVGGSDERHFADLGIEYYRYVGYRR